MTVLGCATRLKPRKWLARAYFDINLDTLWNVVQNHISSLIAELEAVLAAENFDCAAQE